MTAFLSSLFFITMAEMGDKTQLVALAFATRFRAWTVLSGIFFATLLVHLFSVFIGELLGVNLDPFYVQLIAGISFIGFGIWTLRGDELDDADRKAARFSPFWTVAIAFFLAELGDKTMLATVTLAAQYQSFIPVWLGSTFGMVAADAVAIIVGILLGKKLPENIIKWVSAAIFTGFGIFALVELFWK